MRTYVLLLARMHASRSDQVDDDRWIDVYIMCVHACIHYSHPVCNPYSIDQHSSPIQPAENEELHPCPCSIVSQLTQTFMSFGMRSYRNGLFFPPDGTVRRCSSEQSGRLAWAGMRPTYMFWAVMGRKTHQCSQSYSSQSYSAPSIVLLACSTC